MESYENRYPQKYVEEERAADQAGVVRVKAPGPDLEELADQDRVMIYVVVDGQLRVSERMAGDVHITHAWLAGGQSVQAAGEFEIEWLQDTMVVTRFNNVSGHYQPADDSLEVARRAFESWGLRIRPGSRTAFVQQSVGAVGLLLPRASKPEECVTVRLGPS